MELMAGGKSVVGGGDMRGLTYFEGFLVNLCLYNTLLLVLKSTLCLFRSDLTLYPIVTYS